MIWFALLSIRTALGRKEQSVEPVAGGGEPFLACLRRVARVAVVNPLLYIEFLLIPAGAAGTFKDPLLRLEFTFGLIGMAALTCYGYAAGGRACASLFQHRKAVQMFDLACGCLLIVLASTIGLDLLRSFQA